MAPEFAQDIFPRRMEAGGPGAGPVAMKKVAGAVFADNRCWWRKEGGKAGSRFQPEAEYRAGTRVLLGIFGVPGAGAGVHFGVRARGVRQADGRRGGEPRITIRKGLEGRVFDLPYHEAVDGMKWLFSDAISEEERREHDGYRESG